MPFSTKFAASLIVIATLTTSASARPGWGASDWANSRWDRGPSSFPRSGRDDREGKVEVASFAAAGDAASALGRGSVTVTLGDGADNPAFEAAVIDQLVGAGYDTTNLAAEDGQLVELRVIRSVVEPAETKRKPVSGVMEMGISNYGTSMGVGLNLDFSKPKGALVSTRLETRIRDRASGAVLWEGRADIATREGDGDWSDQAIATRLAQSLFKKFPGGTSADYRL